MDLEKFPSSESAKRMLRSVDSGGFYDNSYVGKWIFQIMGLEMDEAKQIIEELPYQAFPETATWGLRYHEQKYGLPVREGLPYEERRRLIYSKRDERAPMNPYHMEVILENISGRKAHVDDESGPVNTFTVTLEAGDNVVNVAALIKKLKEIKQSHVAFTMKFTSLAKLELCGRVHRWTAYYTQCGTSPVVSYGLCMAESGIDIVPEASAYKYEIPMTGESRGTGQYPKVSVGLKTTEGTVEIMPETRGFEVSYPVASEEMKTGTHPKTGNQAAYVEVGLDAEISAEGYKYQNDVAGTVPGTSIGTKEAEKGLAPEVTTECYQVRYRLCGETFEI